MKTLHFGISLTVLLGIALAGPIAFAADVTFQYDPSAGSLAVETTVVASTLEIKSTDGHFVGTQPAMVEPPFGVFVPEKLFILNTDGMPLDFNLGPVLTTGLTHQQLAADLCVAGSVLPSGPFDRTGLLGPDGVEILPFTACQDVLPTPTLPPPPPHKTRFFYDPADGAISLTAEKPLTTLEMKSAGGVFTGTPPDLLGEPFDVFVPEKFFTLQTDGLGDTDFGPIASPGLTHEQLAADLCVAGSVLPSGGLGDAGLVAPDGTVLPFTGCPRPPGRDRFFLTHVSSTGEMELLFDGQEVPQLSTFMIESSRGVFTGPTPAEFDGPFDSVRPDRVFHMDPNGFGELELGPIARPDTSRGVMRRDICVAGSLLDGGELPDIRYPNPTGRVLSVCDVTPPTTGGPRPIPDASDVTLFYDPVFGNLAIVSPTPMTTVEITTSGLALGQPDPGLILPPFDVATPNKLFVLRTDGISIVNFGTVLPPGLSVDELQNELNIIGSLATGGGLGDVRVRLSFIPEPTTSVLLVTALCPLVMLRRRQR